MCVVNPKNNEKLWWEATNSNDDTDESCIGMPTECKGTSPTGTRTWNIGKRLSWLLRDSNEKKTCLKLAVSKIEGFSSVEERMSFQKKLFSFVSSEIGKNYEHAYMPLFLSWFDGAKSLWNVLSCFSNIHGNEIDIVPEEDVDVSFNKSDVSEYFCSELVIETLKNCKIMKDDNEVGHLPLAKSSGEWTVANLANVNNLNHFVKKKFSFTQIYYFCLNRY
jgi:hypothetical protein